jgi:hypothetical protein
MGSGEVTTPVMVSATAGLQEWTCFEMHYAVMFDDRQAARVRVTEAGCLRAADLCRAHLWLGGLPDSPIRKVLAHPHRGHSLESPRSPGASFLGDRAGADHVHVAHALSPSNDGKLPFGSQEVSVSRWGQPVG